MDAERFDALSRALSTTRSRRSLTRLLGGLSLGGVLSARSVREAAAALLNGGYRCTTGSQCKTGRCLGSGTCSCSRTYPRCKQPTNPCKQATCDFASKSCVTKPKEDFTACGSDKQCSGGVCATRPPCLPTGGETDETCSGCCSESCYEHPLSGFMVCSESSKGQSCYYDHDCLSNNNNCVGFVCR